MFTTRFYSFGHWITRLTGVYTHEANYLSAEFVAELFPDLIVFGL